MTAASGGDEGRGEANARAAGRRVTRRERLLRKVSRNVRATKAIAWTARSSERAFLAHIVPIRRCNIACGYCNEHDRQSAPVPLATLERWLDKLQALGASFVTCSGGEPLLHPDIVAVIAGIRRRQMIPGLITNGFLLSPERIRALNQAGLDYLQVSIDNLEPDAVSKKSLRLLERQLQWLADYAEFDVNINSVLGGGTARPDDVRAITARARELGFASSLGVIHDETGRLKPLGEAERVVWNESLGRTGGWQILRNFYSGLTGFQERLIEGKPNEWRCRAGARYLYVAEDGLVSLCSQQRGYPGIPLEEYSVADIRREFASVKPCAPYCTIACSHRVATLDAWLDWFGARRAPSKGRLRQGEGSPA